MATLATTAVAQPVPEPWDSKDPADPILPVTEEPVVVPVYQPAVIVEPEPSAFERIGFSLTAGAGVAGFTGETLRSTTNDGGLWDVRASFGTRSFLTFEAAYVGSAQEVNALGLENSAVLVSNGVQGNLRLNLTGNTPVQPFVFAGAAWRRYNITNTDVNTSALNDEDDVFEIPMGVGVAYKYRGVLFDARGEFRAATDEDLMPSLTNPDPGASASMHRYGVNANVGVEF